MKKYLSLILIFLLTPFLVFALTEEEVRDYEQDIVSSYDRYKEDNKEQSEVDINKYEYTNEETSYRLIIDDKAGLLSVEEKEKLKEDMMPLTQYGHIAFVSINDNPNYNTGSFADYYYHNNFGIQSGTLFLIDMDLREIYIFSDGENYNTITSSKAYLITDNTYKKATAADYYGCAKETFREINELLAGREIMEPMRHITNALIAITLGFFGTFLFMIRKTKIPKASNKQLLEYAIINFDMGEIDVVKTGTSRKYNPPSSSGGGGGSGSSGGGGGGSSGGGGGHSF